MVPSNQNDSTGKVLQFPSDSACRPGFQAVKSTYSVREIRVQFGLSESLIRRWMREGLIPTAPGADPRECYDFAALKQFRRVREMRGRGMSLQQIERELRGQLNLFPARQPELIHLSVRLSPFEEALLLYDAGDSKAVEFFRRAIREKECVADAYCNLGILEFTAGRLTEAFNCFTNSLKEDPRHFESHYNLANLYLEMGDHRLAREHYKIAAALEPNFPDLYFNLGLVHALEGELQAAAVALEHYRLLAPVEEAATAEALLESLERVLAAPGSAK